jgi:hypothetical protein
LRDEHLAHLPHAGRQFVAALQLLDLAVEPLLQPANRRVELALQRLDLRHDSVVLHADMAPCATRMLGQQLFVDRGAGLDALEPAGRLAAQQFFPKSVQEAALLDRLLVVTVLRQALDLGALDRHGALVLVHAAAAEHAHIDHRAGHPRRQL